MFYHLANVTAQASPKEFDPALPVIDRIFDANELSPVMVKVFDALNERDPLLDIVPARLFIFDNGELVGMAGIRAWMVYAISKQKDFKRIRFEWERTIRKIADCIMLAK